jgi:hypothetical protein
MAFVSDWIRLEALKSGSSLEA